jgi:hypothetical protein
VAIYTGAKALSRWPINDESTLTVGGHIAASGFAKDDLAVWFTL